MKIQYLGTAAAEGIPAVFCECEVCMKAKRLKGRNIKTRSQALIDDAIVVDLPPDTYEHIRRFDLDFMKYSNLLITHSHTDHFYPEELILYGEPYAHHEVKPQLRIYGNDSVKEAFHWGLRQNDNPNLLNQLQYQQVEPFVPFELETGHTITPLLARHTPEEKCLIYLIESKGKSLLYANDTGIFPEETWKYLEGYHLDCVSCDCTHQIHADGLYHMGLPDVLQVRKRLEEMSCVDFKTQFIVTHFSHNGGLIHEEMVEETMKYGILTAYDGFCFEF